jgi:predicted ATPase/DNA-binding SARP family transcriptional activator
VSERLPALARTGTLDVVRPAGASNVSEETTPHEQPLALTLLGPFSLRVRGHPAPRFRSRRSEWVLALLALKHVRAVDRSWLAGTLWPEDSEEQSATNLRQILTDLRRGLGEEASRLLSPSRHTLSFDFSGAAVDVILFDTAVARGDPASLERAVCLYEGPLLSGWTEEWVFEERRPREAAYVSALETLSEAARARGDDAEAVRLLRQAVVADPFSESAHRALMQALAASGNYAAATMAYRDLRLQLHRELNAAPSPETAALFEQIRAAARQRATSGPPDASPTSTTPHTHHNSHAPHPSPTPPTRPPLHLPRPLTEFVGRATEVREVAALLGRTRLLTLAGAGGVGKTRLAIEAARQVFEDFNDGVWFADLAPLADAALVAQTVASLLGVRDPGDRPLLEALGSHLAGRSLLLVLDNCEHVLAACAALAEALLQSAPGLRVLATSRHSLGIAGETVWRVPSLSVPIESRVPARSVGELRVERSNRPELSTDDSQLSTLLEYEAVQLFLQRAAAVRPAFALTPANAPAVAQICRRLDGIPLALELAAARLNVLSVEQIAARLDDRFRLLANGNRSALPRQQTLRAAMEWSHALLSEPERVLLRRLSVFAGGWTLEAAEAVCSDDERPTTNDERVTAIDQRLCAADTADVGLSSFVIGWSEVLDLLSALVNKSLVWVEERRGEARYRLLETTREFAAEALRASGEEEAIRERHARYLLALAERERSTLGGAEWAVWLDRLEAERDDLRAALAWFLPDGTGGEARCEEGDSRLPGEPHVKLSAVPSAEAGLRLVTAMRPFWVNRGPVAEGLRWMEKALAGSAAHTEARAVGLMTAARLTMCVTDWERALPLLLESVEIFEVLGDRRRVAEALVTMSEIAQRQEDLAAARSFGERSLALYQEIGDPEGIARSLVRLGRLAIFAGEHEAARSYLRESLALLREAGGPKAGGGALLGLGLLSYAEGDFAATRRFHQEYLLIAREGSHQAGVAWALDNLGDTALAEGQLAEASTYFRESLSLFRDLGHQEGIVECLRGLAQAFTAGAQDPEAARRAARLFGAQHVLRSAIRSPVDPPYQADYERSLAAVRSALGEAAFNTGFAQGGAMPLEEAVAEALRED